MPDEYFKRVSTYEKNEIVDDIYISNYGECYNNTQKSFYPFQTSSINLKVNGGCFISCSRWNMTTSIFNIDNKKYEENRRLKKIEYKLNVMSFKENKQKKEMVCNNPLNIQDDSHLQIYKFEKHNLKNEYDKMLKIKSLKESELKEIESKLKILKNDLNNSNIYSNTVIYIIRPKYNNFYMYVGHTTNKENRLKQHISSTYEGETKLYRTIRDTGGWDNWEMVEIGKYNCLNKNEALKLEQSWCEKLRPNLNSVSPFA